MKLFNSVRTRGDVCCWYVVAVVGGAVVRICLCDKAGLTPNPQHVWSMDSTASNLQSFIIIGVFCFLAGFLAQRDCDCGCDCDWLWLKALN